MIMSVNPKISIDLKTSAYLSKMSLLIYLAIPFGLTCRWLSKLFFAVSICAGILRPLARGYVPLKNLLVPMFGHRFCYLRCMDRTVGAAPSPLRKQSREGRLDVFPALRATSNFSRIGFGKLGLYFRVCLQKRSQPFLAHRHKRRGQVRGLSQEPPWDFWTPYRI